VRLEWDEAKRRANLRKHGVDFRDLHPVFERGTVTVVDDRFEYGEERLLTFGLLGQQVLLIVHTQHDGGIRVISARKANRNEREAYYKEVGNRGPARGNDG
jgi:uncharacterized DUF497 family protein